MKKFGTKEPWQTKGRWYQFLVESDGTDYTLTTADLETATISGTYLKMPADFHILDYKCDINTDTAAAATFTKGIHLYAAGEQACILPDQDMMDWTYVYVFGYFV